jgi:glycosyltransferase involved in cell wall biosynthesis
MINKELKYNDFLLSVIIPVFNEEKTILEIIDMVLKSPYKKEIIIVDDGSTDKTGEILKELDRPCIKIIFHKTNQGKGSAIQSAFSMITGDIILIQDADLEYDPEEYQTLLGPIINGHADVVYGSRFAGHGAHRVLYFWHSIGNKFLTLLSNFFTNLNLTDMETCYKAFTKKAIEGIIIEEIKFGFEPEITAKLAKNKQLRIYEVPISYYGRTYEEGKKINWLDGLWALWCILKYNLFR